MREDERMTAMRMMARGGYRRIRRIFETDDFTKANERLDNGWDLLKGVVSNGKSFYILVKYEEDEKCEGTDTSKARRNDETTATSKASASEATA